MRKLSFSRLTLALAAPLFVASGAASAAEPIATLPTQTVHRDVHDVCPGIDQAMQTALGGMVRLAPADGNLNVRFQIEGDQVTNVHVAYGTAPQLTRAVRGAFRQLGCAAGSASAQKFAFMLHFNDSDDASPSNRVALVD